MGCPGYGDTTRPGRRFPAATPGVPCAIYSDPELQPRWLGLDVLRGAVMVGLAVLVFTPWTAWRGHAAWWGWRPSDVFFPFFLTVAGAGLALQTKRGIPWARVVRRFVALVVIGLLVNALLGDGLNLATLRFTGILQRIGLAGLLGTAVLAVARRRWELVTAAAVGLAVAWGVMLILAAGDCPGSRPTPAGCGTFVGVDRALFGDAHIYADGDAGHDPEGLASTLGATASLLAGTAALVLVAERRYTGAFSRARALALVALGWLLLTGPLLVFAPFGKRVWTPAFVSVNAAAALGLLAVLTLIFDTGARNRAVEQIRSALAWPVVAVGRNALLSWTSLFVIDHAVDVTRSGDRSLEGALVDHLGHMGYVTVMLAGWMAIWCVMHLARWHVRL